MINDEHDHVPNRSGFSIGDLLPNATPRQTRSHYCVERLTVFRTNRPGLGVERRVGAERVGKRLRGVVPRERTANREWTAWIVVRPRDWVSPRQPLQMLVRHRGNFLGGCSRQVPVAVASARQPTFQLYQPSADRSQTLSDNDDQRGTSIRAAAERSVRAY